MSMTLVVRLDNDSVIPLDGGEVLLDGLEVVDEMALSIDLPALSDFADPREVPEEFDGDLDDLRELMGPTETWHDAEAAAAALERLADALGDGAAASLAGAVTELATVLRGHPGGFVLDVLA